MADRALVKDEKAKAKTVAKAQAKVSRSVVKEAKIKATKLGKARAKTKAESHSPPLPIGVFLASLDASEEQGVEEDSDSDGDYDADEPLTLLLDRERERWTIQEVKYFLTGVSCGPP